MFTKRNMIIGGAIVVALLISIIVGYYRGVIHERDRDDKKKIEYIEKRIELSEEQIDSIKRTVKADVKIVTKWKEVIREKEKEYKDVKPPKDTVCLEVYEEYKKSNDNLKTQIVYKDSIINKQDKIIVSLERVVREKDLIIQDKDKIIKIHEDNKKVKQKRWGIGGQLGTTYQDGKVKPYIGVGISYNLINL